MEKKHVIPASNPEREEMEGARRATGISSLGEPPAHRELHAVPNPEVPEKAVRRRFPAAYKLRILKEAEAGKESGQHGALLRREGLYGSHLTTWRRQAEQGTLEALSPRKTRSQGSNSSSLEKADRGPGKRESPVAASTKTGRDDHRGAKKNFRDPSSVFRSEGREEMMKAAVVSLPGGRSQEGLRYAGVGPSQLLPMGPLSMLRLP